MPKKVKMVGSVFGRIKVLEENKERNKNGHITYKCLCECGNKKDILGSSLRSGLTQSCGCLQKEKVKTHGMDGTKSYRSWVSMKSRCYNANNQRYFRYGERGIKVCDRWLHSFSNFLNDMGNPKSGQSIERLDNDGDYEPNNCIWASPKQQARNRSTTVKALHNGKEMHIEEFSKEIGLTQSGARKRLNRLYTKNTNGIFVKEEDL